MEDDFLYEGPILILAYENIPEIVAWNDQTWFVKTFLFLGHKLRFTSIRIMEAVEEISICWFKLILQKNFQDQRLWKDIYQYFFHLAKLPVMTAQ